MLDSINTFFKVERDPFYIMGFKKGLEIGIRQAETEKDRQWVTNIILKLGLSDEETADIVNVSIQFVRKVRRSLNK